VAVRERRRHDEGAQHLRHLDQTIALAAALRETTGLYPKQRGQQWHWTLALELQHALKAQGYRIRPLPQPKRASRGRSPTT
jgi:hypothetical protein